MLRGSFTNLVDFLRGLRIGDQELTSVVMSLASGGCGSCGPGTREIAGPGNCAFGTAHDVSVVFLRFVFEVFQPGISSNWLRTFSALSNNVDGGCQVPGSAPALGIGGKAAS